MVVVKVQGAARGFVPPKGATKRKAIVVTSDDSPTPPVVFSYRHLLRPFKNPNLMKNANRRTKNLKVVLVQERERERVERERRLEKEDNMDVDGEPGESTPDEETSAKIEPSDTVWQCSARLLPMKWNIQYETLSLELHYTH
ncbi:uncharacterized protein FIBRA_03318 [Fibroporia radiculosa]|uniref:Uncharacterized protein n=1 Tax=Fibroporia radiculosa TaxID=599839 RepID=J4H2C2_9APHY|nr:uncharacterized protein FIBRA_03318 [Fibroporia radiculosa]CCM01269.1 predicted protein [Fibroporia radiculosa]